MERGGGSNFRQIIYAIINTMPTESQQPTTLSLEQFSAYLKPRPKNAHKGDMGHVLVIGGDDGYSGAPRMAAEAALRVGAGLVTIATRIHHANLLNLTRPEIMCHGIISASKLTPLIEKATVIIIGPGLGQSSWSEHLFAVALQSERPLVVDADALNLLAMNPIQRQNWILTPHPGEAARLLSLSSIAVQADRLGALHELHSRYGGICLLKGANTLILANNELPAMCPFGNPGMATGGMGDVLSGVIGGLIAQDIPLNIAAKLGVCLHAAAGDLAAKDGERGLLALDLMPYLRRLSNP